MSDQYLDVTVFLPKRDGGKRPVRIGRAKIVSGDKVQIWLDTIPVAGWDGSAVAEPQRERGSQGAPRGNGGGGGSGGGWQPRPQQGPPPDDGFGGDDLPFASQRDTTRARFD